MILYIRKALRSWGEYLCTRQASQDIADGALWAYAMVGMCSTNEALHYSGMTMFLLLAARPWQPPHDLPRTRK